MSGSADQAAPGGVAVLLPHREVYGAVGAGAVSIFVRGACSASAWRARTRVLGPPVEAPLPGVGFVPVTPGSWLHGRRTARYLAGAVRELRRLRPAIVEVHNRPQYIATLRRRLPQARLILYLHNDPRTMKGLAAPAGRARLLEQVDAVVCVSAFTRACMLEGLADHPGRARVHAILNGIDTARFTPPPAGAKRREILFVGRLTPDKGGLLFAEAAARALPALPGWKAVLVGSRWFRDAPRVTDYEQRVAERVDALGEQGEIAGYLTHDQVMERFRLAEIAVVPSLWDEPCSLTAIEAMTCGCAVVATPRGGLPEVVGDAGVLLAAETPEALADVLTALAGDGDRRHALQRSARARAVAELDMGRVAAQLDGVRDGLTG